MSTQENKANVRRYVEDVLNGKNLEVVDEIFTSDCVLQDPNLREESQGSEVIKAFARLCHVVSPDYTVLVEETVGEADTVMISWTASHKSAPEMGDPDTTSDEDEGEVLGISRFRFNNEGKVSSMRQVYRSLDDFTRLVPKEEVARASVVNDPIMEPLGHKGDDGDNVNTLGCFIRPKKCR